MAAGGLKDALLAEIRKAKTVFYNTVVAQAQKIDIAPDQITFTFTAVHRVLRSRFDQNRPARGAGEGDRRSAHCGPLGRVAPETAAADTPPDPAAAHESDLKAQAMAEPAVQALLDVFPSEIRDVEEM